jgi:putative acetyltransferase
MIFYQPRLTQMFTDNKELQIHAPFLPEHYQAIRVLFREYFELICRLPGMDVHADIQNPDAEIAELETGKYAPPSGALLLAVYKGEYAGAVALRKLMPGICEMKRLYVNPKGWGASIGYQLALAIIQKGRDMGYEKMRLDTHPDLKNAQSVYYSIGFYDIPRYNNNSVPGALFMELNLDPA